MFSLFKRKQCHLLRVQNKNDLQGGSNLSTKRNKKDSYILITVKNL